jgi:hypothetical protein
VTAFCGTHQRRRPKLWLLCEIAYAKYIRI